MLHHFGKLLITLGIVIVVIGLVLTFAPQWPFGKLGKLPGDITVKRDNFTFYFPLTTCILISIVLTLIFSFLSRK